MRWSGEERAFAVESYFSNRLSVIATQRTFQNRFNVAPRNPVPDRKSIVTWVTTFRQTGSTTRWTGVPRPIRSSENIRASILQSSWCSARRHAFVLGLSDRSVRRILHDDLHCHPYKMAIVQELSEREGRTPQLVSLLFVKGFSVLQSTGFPLEVSLHFVKGFSVLQFTGSTLDVSLPFVVKHDLKANIREEIANISADTLVRVMTNTRNRFIQCMDNGGRHLPDVILKTV